MGAAQRGFTQNLPEYVQTNSFSSPPDRLASQQVPPGSDEARQMTVGFGRKLSESWPNSSPLGRCLKTLLESPRWSNPAVYLTWKVRPLTEYRTGKQRQLWTSAVKLNRTATKSSRFLFQLAVSAPRTEGTESFLLPTPMGASDSPAAHGQVNGELKNVVRLAGMADVRHPADPRLPDWAGGEIPMPRPLTEPERPAGGYSQFGVRLVDARLTPGLARLTSRERIQRLKALGNANPPELYYPIYKAIFDLETEA
jgi:hypothetical protein